MKKSKVLKLSTSGSVDDGKSTLIGRLLYDTKSLKDDQLEAIKNSSKKRGYDYLDFSLATDGLVAEREQGITIDVAHIYFSTPKRSFIIADTPGHVEYTRNMITGTSTSDLSLILVDARNGVVEQTKRHFFINDLLRTQQVVVVINKMDLVDYSQDRYDEIVADFKALQEKATFGGQNVRFIPVSALKGDNIASTSDNMSWYKENTLLSYLEDVEVRASQNRLPARFQVQTVIRPKKEGFHDYRAYAGKLKSGQLKVGDAVRILPSQVETKIKHIEFYNRKYDVVDAGSAVSLQLENDVNCSRGDSIVKIEEQPQSGKALKTIVCWMDNKPLKPSVYLLQHGVHRVKAKVSTVEGKLNFENPEEREQVEQLKMNDLGWVTVRLAQPLFYDAYSDNKENGAFILIDPQSNTTAGVGFLQ